MTPIESFDHFDEVDEDVTTIACDMDRNECVRMLVRAVKVLRTYPKGQDDGTWLKHRQWVLEYFLPEEDCK